MPPQWLIYAIVFLLTTPTVILSWTSLVTPYELKPTYGTEEVGALVITPREGTAGPSIWLGVFRSCSRLDDSSKTTCDYSSHLKWKPDYDVSILPPSAPLFTLRVLPPQLRVVAWITTFLSTLLWILAAGMACIFSYFRPPGPELTPWMETFRLVYVTGSACVAFIGFITYSIIWVHFKKACDNFNLIYRRPGHPLKDEPDIRAHIGSIISIAYAGYILLLLPSTIVFVELFLDRGNYQAVPAADLASLATNSPRTSVDPPDLNIPHTLDMPQPNPFDPGAQDNPGNGNGPVITRNSMDSTSTGASGYGTVVDPAQSIPNLPWLSGYQGNPGNGNGDNDTQDLDNTVVMSERSNARHVTQQRFNLDGPGSNVDSDNSTSDPSDLSYTDSDPQNNPGNNRNNGNGGNNNGPVDGDGGDNSNGADSVGGVDDGDDGSGGGGGHAENDTLNSDSNGIPDINDTTDSSDTESKYVTPDDSSLYVGGFVTGQTAADSTQQSFDPDALNNNGNTNGGNNNGHVDFDDDGNGDGSHRDDGSNGYRYEYPHLPAAEPVAGPPSDQNSLRNSDGGSHNSGGGDPVWDSSENVGNLLQRL